MRQHGRTGMATIDAPECPMEFRQTFVAALKWSRGAEKRVVMHGAVCVYRKQKNC